MKRTSLAALCLSFSTQLEADDFIRRPANPRLKLCLI